MLAGTGFFGRGQCLGEHDDHVPMVSFEAAISPPRYK